MDESFERLRRLELDVAELPGVGRSGMLMALTFDIYNLQFPDNVYIKRGIQTGL